VSLTTFNQAKQARQVNIKDLKMSIIVAYNVMRVGTGYRLSNVDGARCRDPF